MTTGTLLPEFECSGHPLIPCDQCHWAACLRPNGAMMSALIVGVRHLVQGGAQSLSKFDGIVVGPEMHEEEARLLVQHMAVQRCDLDVVGPQCPL